jgi:hypothetical protein
MDRLLGWSLAILVLLTVLLILLAVAQANA